jgi:hypothetical protein
MVPRTLSTIKSHLSSLAIDSSATTTSTAVSHEAASLPRRTLRDLLVDFVDSASELFLARTFSETLTTSVGPFLNHSLDVDYQRQSFSQSLPPSTLTTNVSPFLNPFPRR